MSDNKSTQKNENIKSSKSKMIIASILWAVISIGILACSVIIYIGIDIIDRAPVLDVEVLENIESSKVLDSDGEIVAELGVYLRENVTYEQMPQSLIDAFVSIEDSRYFEHNGFDLPRFFRALIENVQDSLAAGKLVFSQGGSTLTMQLIDNSYYMSGEYIANNSVEQKLQEIYLSIELEKILSKEEILTYYLNKLNFGGNIRGVEKASEYYFNKNVTELTLSESALLAGIVNLPNVYNPYKNLDYATERRNTVINLMNYHGYITDEEADLAKSINIEDQLVPEDVSQSQTDYPYQSYIDAVIEETIELTGLDPSINPMIIHTNLNQSVQATIDQIQNGEIEDIEFLDDLMQIAIVCMDNSTGEIVALGGGRGYEGERMFNRATDMYKQPGSSVKPYLSYALAFEHLGWATSHVVTDKPIEYRGTSTVLNNFDGEYRGDMTLQDAIGTSMNTPALQTLQEVADTVGPNTIIEYLNDLGFDQVTRDNFDLGYAIGGSASTVTPVQLAAAHATMMNYGKYNTPHTVSKIEFLDGSDPIEVNGEQNQVISEGAAFLAAYMMEANVSGPYFNYMQILERTYPVYAKTGTTDWGDEGLIFGIPEGAMKDKWMVSSTTDYTTSVWFGYDKGVEGEDTYFDSVKSRLNTPGRISSLLLDTLHSEDDPPAPLTQPESVIEITHILGAFPYSDAPGYEYLYTTGLTIEPKEGEEPKVVNIYERTPPPLTSISATKNPVDGVVQIHWNSQGFEPVNELGQKDISLYTKYNQVYATGAQLFNYSWVYGQPHYVAQVFSNGAYVTDVYSDSSYYWDSFGDGNIQVCGYYYTDGGYTSPQVCSYD